MVKLWTGYGNSSENTEVLRVCLMYQVLKQSLFIFKVTFFIENLVSEGCRNYESPFAVGAPEQTTH